MATRVNPYSPGVGSSPPVLAGRGRQLSQISYLADQLEARAGAENIVWSGLRGMGKTVLLHEALDRLRDRGWLAGYSEVRKNAGIGSSVASILLQGQAVLGRGKLAKALGWLRDMAHADHGHRRLRRLQRPARTGPGQGVPTSRGRVGLTVHPAG